MYTPYRPAPPNGPGHCPRCLNAVIWCLTDTNRLAQPVNPGRDPRGNTAIRQDVTGRWRSRGLTRERPTPEHAEVLHIPHAATCPARRNSR
ncbi:hypothetical protein [Streptomyces uncialis]|uniref:hypothetical protein n=1 Tax=Streptomyces uncialis TaxID=1048205 RepID=UPI00224E8173|nr:hypothetical protein [Streptomyces uncialis]MCX4661482.1 hypothetical protein [Streptomyces uncialis]